MPRVPEHLRGIFAVDQGKSPPLKRGMVRAAEKKLGYRLPAAYVALLKIRNGGYLERSAFPTTKCPRWAEDHVGVRDIMGIGGNHGIDSEFWKQVSDRGMGLPRRGSRDFVRRPHGLHARLQQVWSAR